MLCLVSYVSRLAGRQITFSFHSLIIDKRIKTDNHLQMKEKIEFYDMMKKHADLGLVEATEMRLVILTEMVEDCKEKKIAGVTLESVLTRLRREDDQITKLKSNTRKGHRTWYEGEDSSKTKSQCLVEVVQQRLGKYVVRLDDGVRKKLKDDTYHGDN